LHIGAILAHDRNEFDGGEVACFDGRLIGIAHDKFGALVGDGRVARSSNGSPLWIRSRRGNDFLAVCRG
jgi:hypothetical protein